MKINQSIALIFIICLGSFHTQHITAQELDLSVDMEPRWSPDGRWISFLSNRAGENDLWIMDRTGNNLQNLTENIDFYLYRLEYSWSPDSQSLLLTLKQDQRPDIYILSLDGVLFNVTEDLPIAASVDPRWSSDGTKVVFVAYESEALTSNIWVINIDGSNAEALTFGDLNNYAAQWLPQSNTIVYRVYAKDKEKNKEIEGLYSIDVTTKETKQLLKGGTSTSVSQHEDQIAFTTLNSHGRIYLSVLSLTQNRVPKISQITNFSGSGLGSMEEWSFDSKYILFNQYCDELYRGGFSIFSMEDYNMANIVSCDAFNRSPHWSPDGKFIVFESDRNDNIDMWLVDVHTLALINLTLSNSNP